MRIKRKDDFLEGVCTENGIIKCDKCKKYIRMGEKIYKDSVNIDYDLCRNCYDLSDFED